MLEFASLFLGLVWGHQPIEMAVGDPQIARLEFRLDGLPAASREGPPWQAGLDFGDLAPHHLEVVGFAAGGQELARVEQWVNLPRPQADARLLIEQDKKGRPTHARLSWASVLGSQPQRVLIRLDDQPLPVPDVRRFELPVKKRGEIHFLAAELYFPAGIRAHAEAIFGGPYADRVETQLTAFVVEKQGKSAPLDQLRSCFSSAAGQALAVAAVERGAAEVLIVRDRGAEALLGRLRSAEVSRSGATAPANAASAQPSPLVDGPDLSHVLRFAMRLEKEDRVRMVWPFLRAAIREGATDHSLFDTSPILMADLGGLYFFLTQIYPADTEGEQRLADAVALAGLRAAAEGRRRAVLLVLGDSEEDPSALWPGEVRAYLEKLQVPLYVWSGGGDTTLAGEWPPSSAIGTLPALEAAFRQLEQDLDRQVVVWLAGRHLPSQIRFDERRCALFRPLRATAG